MVPYLGDFAEDDTVYMAFNTFTSNDPAASSTITNFINTDVHIHKDDGLTQRNNAAGITVSVDFDGITGSHLIKIDTNDNTVAGFWVTGSEYFVRIEGTTVDAGTVNAMVGHFSIERAGGVLALIKAGNLSANVEQWLGTAAATPTVAGVPEVDVTHMEGGTQTVTDLKDFADAGYDPATNKVQGVVLVDTTTTNTDMVGTDNAALASVLGALTDVTAAGDPTTADTIMQYLKQVINTLEGTAGIPVYPAAADPANNVSIAETLRAIRDDVTGLAGVAMRGTDGANAATPLTAAQVNAEVDTALNTAIPGTPTANSINERMVAVDDAATEARLSELDAGTSGKAANQIDIIQTNTTTDIPATITTLQADTDDIQSRLPAALVGGRIDSNISAINNSNEAALDLERSAKSMVTGAAIAGTLSVTQMTTDITVTVVDQFNGRVVIFASDTATTALRGQATDITATETASSRLTFTALTTAPVAGDTFVIV